MDHSITKMESSTGGSISTTPDATSTDCKLYDKWTLWAHLPHDTNWTFESYIRILSFSSVHAIIMLLETMPDEMITNCMLFIMRDGIKPMWENTNVRPCINGITISPKKNFCIVKIWLANCNYQNPAVIADNLGITSQGCLFKTHMAD